MTAAEFCLSARPYSVCPFREQERQFCFCCALRSNDEREQQINYSALTFAFTGTLIFSLAIGFLQSFGFHPVSWLGIPALMIILWSIGLIL